MSASATIPVITGIGQSSFAKRGEFCDVGEFRLACDAVREAASDSGIDLADIDGVISFGADQSLPALLQYSLGFKRLRAAALAWHPGGGGLGNAIGLAAAAIIAGQAETVVVVRSLCQNAGNRYGRHQNDRPQINFNAPFGLFAPASMVALVMRRHMHEFGTTPEHLCTVATTIRAHAQGNPAAIMNGRPMSRSDYFASRPIADPLRLFDCCLESDGACAVLITSLERARDLRSRPVRILGTAVGSERNWGAGAFGGHNMPQDIYTTGNGRLVAADVFNAAGVIPSDVDVAQIYDAFTAMVLLALEDYGFCARGESGHFVASGSLSWPDGALPTNTAGGNLSEAYIHGLNLMTEAVRQLRGEARNQVSGARIGFVCGAPVEAPTSAMLLAAD